MLKLKEGVQYIRKDGKITGPLKEKFLVNPSLYRFVDPLTGKTYTEDGKFFAFGSTEYDLIAEYGSDLEKRVELLEKKLEFFKKIYKTA